MEIWRDFQNCLQMVMTTVKRIDGSSHPPWTAPGENEIGLWRFDLASPAETVKSLHRLLSSEEQSRAAAFRFDRHRRRWITARGMLRTVLGRLTDTSPESVRFNVEAHGKPTLKLGTGTGTQDLHFNLSHSADVALLAVTSLAPVGIDVERVKPLRDIDAVIARFFSTSERRQFEGLADPTLRLRAFYTCWTRKEAYLKALGCGILAPTDTFDVSFLPDDEPAVLSIDGGRSAAADWSLFNLELDDEYAAALACRSETRPRPVWYPVAGA